MSSLNRNFAILRYASYSILWLIVFAVIQIPIILLVLHFKLGINGYLLLVIPITTPIAYSLTSSGGRFRLFPMRFLFKYLIEPELEKSTQEIFNSLEKPRTLSKSMELLSIMFSKYEIISSSLGLESSEMKTGRKAISILQNFFDEVNQEENGANIFRTPRSVSENFISPMKKSFVDHWISEELVKHHKDDTLWIIMAHCIRKYLENEYVGQPTRIMDELNKILYYIAKIQNDPINYDNVETLRQTERIFGILTLLVFYMYAPEGKGLLLNNRTNVEANLLEWISLVDLSVRASIFPAFQDAPTYFFNIIDNSESSERTIVRRFTERIKSNAEFRLNFLSSLKTFAKLQLDNEKKLKFVTSLRSDIIGSKSIEQYIRLIDNIEFYINLQKKIKEVEARPDIFQPEVVCSVEPTREEKLKVKFALSSGTTIELAESPLLYDINQLEKKGVLSKLQAITSRNITEVSIDVREKKKLRIACWPLGVTSAPTEIMAVWPPTVDSILFLKVLSKEGYYDSKYSHIADVGCGNGILGLSFLNYSDVKHVTFSDINHVALDWVSLNATLNGIDPRRYSLVRGAGINWALEGEGDKRFDLILLSPPYLPSFLISEFNNTSSRGNRYRDVLNCYLVETVDTGLLYNVLTNFKLIGKRLLALYSSIAEDVVLLSRQTLEKRNKHLSEKLLYRRLVPLKIPAVVPSNMEEYSNWPKERLNLLEDLKSRGRLFDPPSSSSERYPFWQEIKIVEFY